MAASKRELPRWRIHPAPRELPAPPVGPVRWRIRLVNGPGFEHVVARTAHDAWRASKFCLAGYAFSAVRCIQDPERP